MISAPPTGRRGAHPRGGIFGGGDGEEAGEVGWAYDWKREPGGGDGGGGAEGGGGNGGGDDRNGSAILAARHWRRGWSRRAASRSR